MARIDDYLITLVEHGGSDLHLCVGLPPKIRIHGRLEPLDDAPIDEETMVALLGEICPEEKWQHYLSHLDLDFAYELKGCARFRTNYMHNHFGHGAVLRVIPTKILTFEQLGLTDVLKEVCHYTRGLVLVTGQIGRASGRERV